MNDSNPGLCVWSKPNKPRAWQRVRGREKPGAERCFVCGKGERPAASCEQWDDVVEAVRKGTPWRKLSFYKPEQVVLCKDCCISELDGHRCEWWRLCWR